MQKRFGFFLGKNIEICEQLGDLNDGCAGPKAQRQCCSVLKKMKYSNLTALPALSVQFKPLVNLVSAHKVNGSMVEEPV